MQHSELDYIRQIRELQRALATAQASTAKTPAVASKGYEVKQEFILPAGQYEMVAMRALHSEPFKKGINPFDLIAIAVGSHPIDINEVLVVQYQGKQYTLKRDS